ncbi:hypothetical protein TNCT_245121 [Trichonephila clavata]|uniref:Uncharacterized protein n=1 Tax=Trichonephila clavata TaxID=2740835 RepID=A0A8X6IHP5_TRICU|nr:hypothetical protein TNCT_245121 [Trichonephila clavata]
MVIGQRLRRSDNGTADTESSHLWACRAILLRRYPPDYSGSVFPRLLSELHPSSPSRTVYPASRSFDPLPSRRLCRVREKFSLPIVVVFFPAERLEWMSTEKIWNMLYLCIWYLENVYSRTFCFAGGMCTLERMRIFKQFL